MNLKQIFFLCKYVYYRGSLFYFDNNYNVITFFNLVFKSTITFLSKNHYLVILISYLNTSTFYR